MTTTLFRITLALAISGAVIAGCGERTSNAAPEESARLPSSSEPSHPAIDLEASAPTVASATPPADERLVEDTESLAAPTPELYSEGGLTLRRFALSRSVEGREPVDPAFAFPIAEAPLFAFVDVANTTDEERSVRVIFESPGGEEMGMVDLDIPGEAPRWRTWAYSRMITEAGTWQARVESDEGELLGRISFEIEAS